jgi:PleD family two-component response regulator
MEMGADDYLTKPFAVRTFKCYRNQVKEKKTVNTFYSKSLENLDHLQKTNGLTELKKLYPSEN